ncbi:MAG: hypothetical protein JWP81_795 [Ferruginibacter sp.]|nr:hypothetical protein [Ferruginibacter sp.]
MKPVRFAGEFYLLKRILPGEESPTVEICLQRFGPVSRGSFLADSDLEESTMVDSLPTVIWSSLLW